MKFTYDHYLTLRNIKAQLDKIQKVLPYKLVYICHNAKTGALLKGNTNIYLLPDHPIISKLNSVNTIPVDNDNRCITDSNLLIQTFNLPVPAKSDNADKHLFFLEAMDPLTWTRPAVQAKHFMNEDIFESHIRTAIRILHSNPNYDSTVPISEDMFNLILSAITTYGHTISKQPYVGTAYNIKD